MDFPCICNDPKGMHEMSIGGVCTRRYCACISYKPLASVPGVLRNQERHLTASDLAIQRYGKHNIPAQKVLVVDE